MAEKVEVIAELKDLISGKFRDINSQIDAMDSKLSKINSGGGKGIMGQVLGANLLTGAISRAGGAMLQFGQESFEAFGKQEQFQVALKTLLYGNAEQAEALNNQLKQFALETPFELSEVQQSTRLLIAYGSSAGKVVDEMRMLGDVSSGTAQPLNEIAYLYGTIRTQQKANLIDLRQFANRGIPIFKELAKVTKYSLAQLVEGGKDVDITFTDVEKAFKNMAAAGGQFHNMMGEQSKTLLGQTSNLSDAWNQLQASIGKSQEGILKGTVEWATNMVREIGRVVDRENFKEKAFGGLPDYMNLNKTRGGMYDERDRGYSTGTYGTKDYKLYTRSEYEKLSAKDKNQDFSTVGTKELYRDFSQKIFDEIKTLKPEDAQAFENKLVSFKREIDASSKVGQMSPILAANELAIISSALKDIKGIKSLDKDKNEKPAKEPAKLETLAKQNRAVQLIVNIENLVRDLTNVVNTPAEAKQLDAIQIAKTLTGAVNDFEVAAGQGS